MEKKLINSLNFAEYQKWNAGLDLTLREVSKYRVFCGPYFPVFSPHTGKYGPEKTPYLDTFHTV